MLSRLAVREARVLDTAGLFKPSPEKAYVACHLVRLFEATNGDQPLPSPFLTRDTNFIVILLASHFPIAVMRSATDR